MLEFTVHLRVKDGGRMRISDRPSDVGGAMLTIDGDTGSTAFIYLTPEAENALLTQLSARSKVLKFPARGDNFRAPSRERMEATLALLAEVGGPDPGSAA